jgi:hypothetical protein
VRHVRILGLCLLAMFAVSAMVAVPAMAKETKEEKEEQRIWPLFKQCPLEEPEVELCFAGITNGGKKGGFFSLGGVTVPLNKPIILQGGLREGLIVPATTETLESPELKVPGGIGLISKRIQESSEWPAELTALWNEAKKNHESSMYVKIEVGGTELYEIFQALNPINLILERGPAFTLPLKVKMTGPFLEKLGGGPCDFGNDTTPTFQHLRTEPSVNGNAANGASTLAGGELVVLFNSRLGDAGWPVPEGAQVSGCGGGYESYVDTAINKLLLGPNNYPGPASHWAHGLTLLEGTLYMGTASTVKEKL